MLRFTRTKRNQAVVRADENIGPNTDNLVPPNYPTITIDDDEDRGLPTVVTVVVDDKNFRPFRSIYTYIFILLVSEFDQRLDRRRSHKVYQSRKDQGFTCLHVLCKKY